MMVNGRRCWDITRWGAGLLAIATLYACGGAGIGGGSQEQVVADYPIVYVKRPIPVVANSNPPVLEQPDVREPAEFNEGGDLYLRDRASPTASERNITQCITGGTGDVRDVEADYAGEKFIFSLRLEDPDENDDVVPTWNIYEYDIEAGGCPRRLITSDIAAEKGDDLAPHYLPDGRIVFSSSRQEITGQIQLDEGKPQYRPLDEDRGTHALVLHVMSASGTDIKQISFNQSHDLDPTVRADGEILFSRWDHMGSRNAVNLYTVRPDGTEPKALFGAHDHALGTGGSTVQFLSPRAMPDGRVMAMIKPFTGSAGGGAPVLIDVANYTDDTIPTWPNQGLLAGPGQESAIDLDVRTDGSISPAGRFRSVYPLNDGSNRALVSWSQCRLIDPDDDTRIIPCPQTIPGTAVEALPAYGIYVYDIGQNTQLPVVLPQAGMMIDEPVVALPRALPTILFNKSAGIELEQDLIDENVGVLHIRSVYDFDGSFNALGAAGVTDLATMANPTLTNADQRPARFLRLVKAASIPDEDVHDFDATAFGASTLQSMREILGYVPIEADGSVMVKVPANVPIAFSVVDRDGRRLGARHQNWFQIKPGEVVSCNGCHDHTALAPLPHGYRDDPDALNSGAATAAEFPGTTTDIDPDVMVIEPIVAELGETMAQAKIRALCSSGNGINYPAVSCPQLSPSVNPLFTDTWANGAIAAVTNMRYADLDPAMPALPASVGCQTTWNANCRVIINYEDHIHPLWDLPRTVAMVDRTCTSCHTNTAMVPDAQLDLTDGPSDQEADHYKAYRELLFADNEVDAAGADVLVDEPSTDADGNPIIIQVPVPVAGGPSMSVNGSRFGRFMGMFLTGGTHAGDLSAAELRLLAEWLDIGAQYYNNPFDAPTN